MKKLLIGTILSITLAGCNGIQGGVSTTVGVIASIVSHSTQACSDIAALGADVTAVTNQVAAANPNDARIQRAAASIASGAGATNSDCQRLAASFRAEAPKSLLAKRILVDPKILGIK